MGIELLILDIDGVLTQGEAKGLDLDLMATLAGLNRRARQSSDAPGVTVCSGRPAPYVEAILQAIDGHIPAVFENGAGLYLPLTYEFLSHPAARAADVFAEAKQRLLATLVASGLAFVQPGKEYTLTLFATDASETSLLYQRAADALGPLTEEVALVYSTSCLNVLPRGVDKGQGIAFLSERSGIPADRMLGIGDSDVDLPFLACVGKSAAPSNANPSIKEIVDYVSTQPTSHGVRDILSRFEVLP